MKWKNEKDELERLINVEHVSYEEIGRRYSVSGEAVRRAASRLGIELPKRRKINPNEHFNRGTAKKSICLNCGKEIILYQSTNGKFCSAKCQQEWQRKEYIEKWKNGEISGTISNGFSYSKIIKRYLLEKNEYKCEKCGFGGENPYTHNTILQIHHIDGDSANNREENLQVLCPNCHAMTDNFGSRNKNASKGRSEYFGRTKAKQL